MPLKYALRQLGKTSKDDKNPLKYYPIAKNSKMYDLKSIAENISQTSTLSTVDVVANVEAFVQNIIEKLQEGDKVKLGDLGIFHLSIRSKGVWNIRDFHKNLIKEFKINFSPSKRLKQGMKNISIQRVE